MLTGPMDAPLSRRSRIALFALIASTIASPVDAEDDASASAAPVAATAPAPQDPAAPAEPPQPASVTTPPSDPASNPTTDTPMKDATNITTDTANSAPPAAEAPKTSASADVTATRERRVGDPIPLTRREPTLPALGFMLGLRYGLVGSAPTRFVDDIRFGITDTVELRTALLPYPSSLMVRARFGSQQAESGALVVDAGLAHWDAGLRIVPDTGEPKVGTRFHFEGGLGYIRALGDRAAFRAQAHYRYRLSFLDDDDQHAAAVDAHVTYDLLESLAVSAGLGVASTLGTPVRELSILFVETDAPGMSHLLARDDGVEQSVTIPLSMTYGRVENFDVDLFCTTRVWPEVAVVFGAGLRLRFEPFRS